jgi:putative ABC transport system permease protein
MAASIASVSGVYGAVATARQWLGRDSRLWLAGDVAADTTEPVSDPQMAALDEMRRGGIEWTMITWTLTMAASDQSPDSVLISVKAIDPAVYPFYGETSLNPPRTLAAALRPDSVVVSDRVLERLRVRLGDRIRVGGVPFVIAGVIGAEPERPSGILGYGPRCILSRPGFERIAATGNSRTNRILLRLPSGSGSKAMLSELQSIFPEGRVFDYRDAAATEVARLEMVISFVSLVAFLAFTLGAIGVATAVRLNLEQRMETLATMRIVGARTSQMASLFVFETAAMLMGGLAVGTPLGWVMKGSLLSITGKYLVLPHRGTWDQPAILQSAIAAAAIMGPLLAGPAGALRRLRPLAVLRRDIPESSPSRRGQGWLFAAAVAVSCAAVTVIAYRMIEAWKPALFVVGALALTAGLAWAAAAGALQYLNDRISFSRRAPALRHALVGLCRSRGRSLILIVCIALGVMIVAATFSSSGAATLVLSATLPEPDTNLMVADFDDSGRETVRGFLERQPGVERVEVVAQTWLRVVRVNGVPVEESRYLVRCAATPPAGAVISDELASRLGVSVGSDLEFETRDGTVHTTLRAIHHPRPEEKFWFTFIVDCSVLPRSSLFQSAAIRVRPDRIEEVRRAVNAEFPTLATITFEEFESTLHGVTDDAMSLVRVVTWTAAAGGLLILISIVAASRTARSREIAILAALGATRRTILKIYSLEFAALGALSGAIGGVLACGFSAVITMALFHRPEAEISWRALAGTVLISPLLTLAAGWLPTYRLLSRKPLVVLRHERV